MAQHFAPNDPTALTSGRSSENRPPQFIGGSIDPTTGNLVPSSRTQTATGRQAAVEDDIPEPSQPTSKLRDVTADSLPQLAPTPTPASAINTSSPKTDYGALLTNAAINTGIGVIGKGVSNALSGSLFGGSGDTSNPMNTTIGGGDLNNTGAGSSSGSGSAPLFEFPTPGFGGGSDYSSSPSSSPLDLSPPSYYDTPSYMPTYGGPSYYDPAPPSSFGYTPTSDFDSGGGGGGDGSVLCEYFSRKGKFTAPVYVAAHVFIDKTVSEQTKRGYQVWAVPLVARMQVGDEVSAQIESLMWPMVDAVVRQFAHRGDPTIPGSRLGRALVAVGLPLCWLAGFLPIERDWRALWAR